MSTPPEPSASATEPSGPTDAVTEPARDCGPEPGPEPGTEFVTQVEPFEEGAVVVVRLPDEHGELDAARLWSDVDLGVDAALHRVERGWERRLSHLPVDRLEYQFEVERHGEHAFVLDPTNPLRVGGAFGDHSWLPLPGYEPPAWLDAPQVEGARVDGHAEDTPVGLVEWQVWSPADAAPDEPLPLLAAHDGPEMDTLGGLTAYVAAMIAAGRLPRMRVALLVPGERDERYAANPSYSQALCEHVLPAILREHPSDHVPALLGASLGAVAALHARWHHPGSIGALWLASGSFFTPALDPQESTYSRWTQVTDFVAEVGAADALPAGDDGAVPPPHVAVVCGTAEENLANNEAMADHLRRLGCPLTWGSVRDGHCYTCWRDLLDPHLTGLLAASWGAPSDRMGAPSGDHPLTPGS